jgi:serine/threonine-protein kinase
MISRQFNNSGTIAGDDPVPTVSGMILLSLDTSGRLVAFDAIPPQKEKPGVYPAPNWSLLFAAAGFDLAQFRPDEPQWTPVAATDARAAWTGRYPGNPNLPIRVETAAFHGLPVHFEIVWPSSKPTRMAESSPPSLGRRLSDLGGPLLDMLILAVGIWLARYNWKAGRGDVRGAARLGIFIASIALVKWLLSAHQVADPSGEYDLLKAALATAAYKGIRLWILYLALEPWVRRYWPQSLVTWTRLLAGQWRDPLVGRDVLFGILLGLLYLLLFQGFFLANVVHGGGPEALLDATNLKGARFWASSIIGHLDGSVGGALFFFLVLFVLRAVFRKQWLAGTVFVLMFVVLRWAGVGPWYTPLFLLAIWTTLVVVMLRFGLFATVCLVYLIDTPLQTLLTTDFTAWYGQSSWAFVALVAAAAVWGFRTSLGGRTLMPARS